jgi:2-phosphosulfolactate phosphatase
MKINVLYSPQNADELYFTGKTAVVIDVLRASSTIITAIEHGAKEVIPVSTVEFAVKVSGGMFGGQTLLCGERNSKKIEGFALGNSPLEYTKKIVDGKSIIYYTTNGSKAILKAKFSENLFVCTYNNLTAVAKHLVKLDSDVEILCSGNNNLFSLEDSVCAGRLVREIIFRNSKTNLSDSAKGAWALEMEFGKNTIKMLKESEHGVFLIKNGFEEDVTYCGALDSSGVIPVFKSNILKALAVQ